MGLDSTAVSLAAGYLERQIKALGCLQDDKTILVEHFRDSSGNSQLMFHSVFGRRINAPLSLLAAQTARERLGIEIGSVDEEDGFYCIRMEAEHCQKASYRAFLLTPVSEN